MRPLVHGVDRDEDGGIADRVVRFAKRERPDATGTRLAAVDSRGKK